MRSLRASYSSVCFALAVCLALSSIGLSAEVVKQHRFPFPVEIDAKAGKTGEYPNRVKDRRTGTWLVFVPGGKYKIGTDKRPDSKVIEVTLSGFYISQAQVGGEAFAKAYLAEWERELASFIEDLAQDEELNLPKKLTPAAAADLRLVCSYWSFTLSPPWSSSFLGGLSGWDISFDVVGFDDAEKKLEALSAVQDKRVEEGKPAVPLTPAERKVLEETDAAIRQCIRKAGVDQESAVRRVSYEGAKGYVASQGLSLPTEAQWEVAAKLTRSKRAPLKGMFDEVLEWCSNHYPKDAIRRKPKTDTAAEAKRDQGLDVEAIIEGAKIIRRRRQNRNAAARARRRRVRDAEGIAEGAGIVQRLLSGDAPQSDPNSHVVRGRGASTRDFTSPEKHGINIGEEKSKHDIGFRVVYNPKPPRSE